MCDEPPYGADPKLYKIFVDLFSQGSTVDFFPNVCRAKYKGDAVVVALYLARRSETVRLRALLSIDLSPTDPSRLVILQINNIGVRAGALTPPPFFEWRISFRRKRQPETMVSSINAA
jgi:hypothetical protein